MRLVSCGAEERSPYSPQHSQSTYDDGIHIHAWTDRRDDSNTFNRWSALSSRFKTSRRSFLYHVGTAAAVAGLTGNADAAERTNLIGGIEKVTLRRGRDGSGPTWFHPRARVVPNASGSSIFMTLQTISGSDYFGPVQWMISSDLRTWSEHNRYLHLAA